MAVEYRPADYYSSASPERVLPPWASYGCGAASVLALILVFAGGAFLSHGGFVQLMDMVFGMTMGEIRGMYATDVTAAQKQSLENEIETLRRNLRAEKIPVQRLNPLLQTMRRTMSDEKLHGPEVEELTAAARRVATSAPAHAP